LPLRHGAFAFDSRRPAATIRYNNPTAEHSQRRIRIPSRRESFMHSIRTLAMVAALVAAVSTQAQTLGTPSTYSGLTWSVSTDAAGLGSCTQLLVDATGDVTHSDNFAMYGQLYCPSLGGGYASSGSAYFDSSNNFHMTVSLGVTYQLVCDNLNGGTLTGSCPVYNNAGTQVGSAFVTFL
jgi:hypothetical protein